jgi:DNA-binding beta-propeller fold protein YncE
MLHGADTEGCEVTTKRSGDRTSDVLSRRRFLAGVSASAGVLAVSGALASCSSDADSSQTDMRAGTVGLGAGGGRATGYDRLVLHAGPSGQIVRDWFDHHSVVLARRNGRVVRHGARADPGLMNSAAGAAQAPDGTFWVADRGNDRLIHLDVDFALIGAVTSVAGRPLGRPRAVTMVGERVAVTDSRSGQIAISDSNGDGVWVGVPLEQTLQIGSGDFDWGRADPGVLDHPTAIAATPDGHLVVFDPAARRLTRFDANAQAIATVALFGHPTGFTIDPAGAMYLADSTRQLVYRVDENGAETNVAVFDRDRKVEISASQADSWQPLRLTWREGATGLNGLIVSLFPPIRR